MTKFTPFFINYDRAQTIPTNCNSIIFINLGTTTALIENVSLAPTQSFSIDGNACEFTDATIQINFSGAGNNNLVVVKKVF